MSSKLAAGTARPGVMEKYEQESDAAAKELKEVTRALRRYWVPWPLYLPCTSSR